MATNYLTLRNTQNLNPGGSTISDGSINITSTNKEWWTTTLAQALNYSSLTGSTMTTRSMGYSTLTGSTLVATGAVGIGTTTTGAGAVLDVYGTTYLARGTANRYLEMNADNPNLSYIDFHSKDNATGVDFDARIISNGGGGNSVSGGARLDFIGSTFYMSGTPGNVGIGTTAPNAPLQFSNDVVNRKLVLYASGNNDHQYIGFGVNAGALRYQVDTSGTDHVFYTGSSASASTELMRIRGNGNVGIGTNAPIALLHVYGLGTSGGTTGLRDNTLRIYGYQPGIYITGSATGGNRSWNMWVGAAAGDAAGLGAFNLYDDTAGALRFAILSTGVVRLPAYANGTLSIINGDGTISSSSDIRLKENILYQTNTADALQQILQLKPATFNFIDGYGAFLGFIAQDVEKVIPLAVDGKKYEWVYEMDEKGMPKLDENGQVMYKLDEQGQKMIRPRGLDNRAIIAVQTLAIQELAARLSAKTEQLDGLLAWARTMGYSG